MAKDHVFDDILVRAHAAAQLKEHASPIAKSRYLVNEYMEALPQYLADNPDQLPDPINPTMPDPAKRNEPLPPMSEEAKARRKAEAEARNAIKTEHGVLYKKPEPEPEPDVRRRR